MEPPIITHKQPNARSRQSVREILRESGVELIPDSPIGFEIESGIKRVWSTLWGWCGDRLKRVRVDNEGNLIVSKGWSTNTRFERIGPITVNIGTNYEFAFSQVCNKILVFNQSGVMDLSFGLASGDYYVNTISDVPVIDGVTPRTGSLYMFEGLARFVKVDTTFVLGDIAVTAIGYYNQ